MINISTFLRVAGALLTRPFIALVIPRPRPVQSAVVQQCSVTLHQCSLYSGAAPIPASRHSTLTVLYCTVLYNSTSTRYARNAVKCI